MFLFTTVSKLNDVQKQKLHSQVNIKWKDAHKSHISNISVSLGNVQLDKIHSAKFYTQRHKLKTYIQQNSTYRKVYQTKYERHICRPSNKRTGTRKQITTYFTPQTKPQRSLRCPWNDELPTNGVRVVNRMFLSVHKYFSYLWQNGSEKSANSCTEVEVQIIMEFVAINPTLPNKNYQQVQ